MPISPDSPHTRKSTVFLENFSNPLKEGNVNLTDTHHARHSKLQRQTTDLYQDREDPTTPKKVAPATKRELETKKRAKKWGAKGLDKSPQAELLKKARAITEKCTPNEMAEMVGKLLTYSAECISDAHDNSEAHDLMNTFEIFDEAMRIFHIGVIAFSSLHSSCRVLGDMVAANCPALRVTLSQNGREYRRKGIPLGMIDFCMTSMEQGRHSLNEPERRRVMAQCQEYYAQSFLAANSTRGDRSTPGSRLNSADYSVMHTSRDHLSRRMYVKSMMVSTSFSALERLDARNTRRHLLSIGRALFHGEYNATRRSETPSRWNVVCSFVTLLYRICLEQHTPEHRFMAWNSPSRYSQEDGDPLPQLVRRATITSEFMRSYKEMIATRDKEEAEASKKEKEGGGRDMVASAFPRGRASNRMSLIGMTSPGTYPDWKQSVPGLHPLLSYGEGDGLV
jgi:hypothetical protein